MARASFNLGGIEKKPKFSLNFLKDDEDEAPFDTRLRGGLASAFSPVYDGINQQAFRNVNEDEMPNYPAMDAFRKHMRNIPYQEDYQPSGWRKLGAALVGFGAGMNNPGAGYSLTKEVLDNPYKNAYRNWQLEASNLKDEADIEQQNVQRSQQWYKTLRDYADKEADNKREDKKVSIEQQKLERDLNNDKIEQDFKIKKLEADGWKTERIDGRVIMLNPVTNEKMDLGADADVRIRDANTRIAQQNADTNRMNADTSKLNAGVNFMNVRSLIDTREDATDIAKTRADAYASGRTKYKNVPLREQYYAEAKAAAELANINPKYAKYLEKDDKGNITGVKRPSSWFGIDEDEFSQFLDEVEKKKEEFLNKTYGSSFNTPEIDFSKLQPQ